MALDWARALKLTSAEQDIPTSDNHQEWSHDTTFFVEIQLVERGFVERGFMESVKMWIGGKLLLVESMIHGKWKIFRPNLTLLNLT